MYRPNRIGPHQLGNLNKALLVDAKSSFDAVDSIWTTYSAYSLNTSSGVNIASEHVVFSDNTLSLIDTSQVGIGIQVGASEEEEEIDFIYTIAGSLTCHTIKDIIVEFCIGRLAAAPSTSAAVTVANPIVIPLRMCMHGADAKQYSVCQEIIMQRNDGGSAPSTWFDICAFWRIVNNDQATANFRGLTCNISLHKYVQDLHTFDPTR